MRIRFIAGAALFALTLAVYAGVSELGWHARDDEGYVLRADWISQGITREGLARAFVAPHLSNWHPLTSLSHMLDSELFGTAPGPPHQLNAFLHAANAVLLFAALYALTQSFTPSLFVAAFFALHPLGVETVAWVSERKNLLSTGFGFAALWCWAPWARRRSVAGYAAALALFALSLLSKPMLVTFPFVLLLFDVWPLQRLRGWGSLRAVLIEKLPFFVLAAASSIVTWLAQGGALWEPASVAGRLGRAMLAYAGYVEHAFWPAQLVVHYPYVQEVGTGAVLAAAAFVIGVSAAALFCVRRWPFFAVGWAFFLGTLVPVLGIVQVGTQSMADRYMYVPIVGLAIVVAWGSHALLRARFGGRAVEALLGLVVVVALLASAQQTRRYLEYWRSDLILFTRAVEHTHENHIALTIRCALLGRGGRPVEALADCREAVRIEPRMATGRHELGVLLLRTGDAAAAVPHLEEAARLDPRRAHVLLDLGQAHERNRDPDAAAHAYSQHIVRRPGDDALEPLAGAYRSPVALEVLAAALADRGRFDEARERAQEAEQWAREAGEETLADSIAARAARYSEQAPL